MEKKLFIVMALAAVLACPVMAAMTVNVTQDANPSFPHAPYTITWVTGQPSWSSASFETFCVEWDRYFYYNDQPYTATIDGVVMYGGGTPTTLTQQTQVLYAAYLNGDIGGTDIGDNKIQNEIWWYESGGLKGADGSLYGTLTASNYNYQNVKVINLWNDTEYVAAGDRQSMLIMVPAPGAIMLASMGMGLVGWLRRRQAL